MMRKKILDAITGCVIITTLVVGITIADANKLISNAGAAETTYATFTHSLSEKVTKLSDHSSYGKVRSINGAIGYWIYNNAKDYSENKPSQKGKVTFKEDGTWSYAEYITNPDGTAKDVIMRLNGKGRFDFQRILEKNKSGKKFLNIKFFEGDYNVHNLFRVYSNTNIWGVAGEKSTLHKMNNTPVFITFDDSTKGVKAYNGTYNVKIRDLVVNCLNKESDVMVAASIIFAAHGKDLVVKGVTVTNGIATHALQLASMQNVTVSGCTFKNLNYIAGDTNKPIRINYSYCKNNNIVESNSAFNQEVIQIESDTCGSSKNGMVYSLPTAKLSHDDTPCTNVKITGCTFDNVLRAIGNHSTRSNSYQTDIFVKNSTFKNIVGDAIRMPKYKNIGIKGNNFEAISSTLVGGQRIRLLECKDQNNNLYSKNKNTAYNLANNNTYYSPTYGKIRKISEYKDASSYKITVK